jgi:hypothetical protein
MSLEFKLQNCTYLELCAVFFFKQQWLNAANTVFMCGNMYLKVAHVVSGIGDFADCRFNIFPSAFLTSFATEQIQWHELNSFCIVSYN